VGGGLGGAGLIGIIVALLFTFLGGGGGFNPGSGLDQLDPTPAATEDAVANGPDPDANLVAFLRFVVEDVQDSWEVAFVNLGGDYEPTTLRIFRQGIRTGCGAASSAAGPFYCPVDRFVYLDLGFFRELRDRFQAPGDFAQAYVVAHEFGHHVQNLLGIIPEVNRRQRDNPSEANELSVRLELQADCFAGVWAHHADEKWRVIEPGDVEAAMQTASAIGDDRLQRRTQGYVVPDAFTHGSSEQRVRWFMTGLKSGDVASCNTFDARQL
jgi:predicted metalloprotease